MSDAMFLQCRTDMGSDRLISMERRNNDGTCLWNVQQRMELVEPEHFLGPLRLGMPDLLGGPTGTPPRSSYRLREIIQLEE